MNKVVYKWNEFPVDILTDKNSSNWFSIDTYEILGETAHYVRARRINEEILPDRRITHKYRRKDFEPVFESYREAVSDLERVLLLRVKVAEESLQCKQKNYSMFRLQFYGKSV